MRLELVAYKLQKCERSLSSICWFLRAKSEELIWRSCLILADMPFENNETNLRGPTD